MKFRELKNYYLRIQVVKFENNVQVLNTEITLKQIEKTKNRYVIHNQIIEWGNNAYYRDRPN